MFLWFGNTVYPKKYAHGFVVLCFVVVMQSFIMNSHGVFIHIHQGCFAGTGAIVRLPQCQWSKPDGYGKISQCITTTKHSKAKTVCIFLGIYCSSPCINVTPNITVITFRFNIWAMPVKTHMLIHGSNLPDTLIVRKDLFIIYMMLLSNMLLKSSTNDHFLTWLSIAFRVGQRETTVIFKANVHRQRIPSFKM